MIQQAQMKEFILKNKHQNLEHQKLDEQKLTGKKTYLLLYAISGVNK